MNNSICEHEWIEYDDPAAYNDGLNCPTVAICSRCGAQKDIRNKYADTKMNWHEDLTTFPCVVIFILYIAFIAPVILLIRAFKEEFMSTK